MIYKNILLIFPTFRITQYSPPTLSLIAGKTKCGILGVSQRPAAS